ncbi:helix-turn-helix domain-containing protein [Roseobacter weihaiensis]|uniref:helix-turn-helix domain-containing protein n=1 Tax=Roseobacter weihaiensis TaxID=2763262 RepID=UPI001D09FA4D|nr:helix-turn-helix domain-containing protein [Roseobacter sp. H9]
MSEQISFDRKKGFVALPVEIMDQDLSPGAFRTLAELCRMANTEGFCWPSLHQLSERLGRSRSAISGYIKELREAGLVETQEQKTANGYNYRLKYEVTFWRDWRASLRGRTGRKTERSVQPTERKTSSINHKHINHDHQEIEKKTANLLKKWAHCFAGAPYPMARHTPDPELITATKSLVVQKCQPLIADNPDTADALAKTWRDLGIPVSDGQLREQMLILANHKFNSTELGVVLAGVRKKWPPHWHHAPSADAFGKLVKSSGKTSLACRFALLESHQKRWALAEKTLHRTARSCSLGGQAGQSAAQ